MISWLAQQLRYLFGFLWTNDSPRQIACGIALGVVLGLTPKGNLLAVLVATLLLALRVNPQAGMLSALLVSFVTPWCDPLADVIGQSLLASPRLHPLWTRLYNIPLVPWSGFNNTLVLGSFTLGWLLFYPTYRASLPAVARWQAFRKQRRQNAGPGKAAAATNGAAILQPPDEIRSIAIMDSPEAARAREMLRRRRFRDFVAEVESLSQRRGAA